MTDIPPVIIPEETELTEPFWTAARGGELLLQRCENCRSHYHPPQPVCANCLLGGNLQWIAASGLGLVHAVTVVQHAAHPAVSHSLPYVVILVQLVEGPLMISAPPKNADGRSPAVGSRVRVVFELIDGTNVALPRFEVINSPILNKDGTGVNERVGSDE